MKIYSRRSYAYVIFLFFFLRISELYILISKQLYKTQQNTFHYTYSYDQLLDIYIYCLSEKW